MQTIKVRTNSVSFMRLVARISVRLVLASGLACLLYLLLANLGTMLRPSLFQEQQQMLTYTYSTPLPADRIKRPFKVQFKNLEHPYWLEEPASAACANDTKLFILILSRRETYVNRQAIRSTWYKDRVNGTVLRFFLSDENPNKDNPADIISNQTEEITRYVLEEHAYYGDTVFLEGIEDTYANLHLMMHAAFQWQQAFCPQAKYVLKTDDDTVIHLARLDHWMDHKFTPELQTKNEATCFGCPVLRSKPIRYPYHRWYVAEEVYPNKTYPDYIQGCTYLCSGVAIQRIMAHCPEVNAINMEDVLYTGLAAEKANVSRSDQRWHFYWGGPNFNQTNYCKDGVPYITAVFGHIYKMEMFEYLYERVKSLICRS